MFRYAIAILLSAALQACTSVQVDQNQSRSIVAKNLGIEQSKILYQDYVRYTVAPRGARSATFRLGLYVQTATDLYLFQYESERRNFARDISLPLAKVNHAAIESWGMFNHLKQLQVAADFGVIAVNFNNSSDAMAGDAERTNLAYANLLSAKVRTGSSFGRVLPTEASTPIPVFIPSR